MSGGPREEAAKVGKPKCSCGRIMSRQWRKRAAQEKDRPEVRGYLVRIDGMASPTLFAGETVAELVDALTQVCGVEDMDNGATVEIEVKHLTRADLEAMGEFDGF